MAFPRGNHVRLTSFSFLVMVLSLADEGPVVVNFAGICQVCRVILEGEMGRTPSELLGAFCLLQRITDKGSWLMAPCHPAGGIPAGSRWTPDIRPVLSNIRTRDFYEEIKALPVRLALKQRMGNTSERSHNSASSQGEMISDLKRNFKQGANSTVHKA